MTTAVTLCAGPSCSAAASASQLTRLDLPAALLQNQQNTHSTRASVFSFSTSAAAASLGEPGRICVDFCFFGADLLQQHHRRGIGAEFARGHCARLFCLGALDAHQRGVAQLVAAGLHGQHRRRGHFDRLEPPLFKLALHLDAGIGFFHVQDQRGVGQAEQLGNNDAGLAQSQVFRLQAGQHQVGILRLDGRGQQPRHAQRIASRQIVADDMDCPVRALGQRLADGRAHALRPRADDDHSRRRADFPSVAAPLPAHRRRARSWRTADPLFNPFAVAAIRTGASRSGTCLMATMIFIFQCSWVAPVSRLAVVRVSRPAQESGRSVMKQSPRGNLRQYPSAPARLRLLPRAHPETSYCRKGRPRRCPRAGRSQLRRAHVAHALARLFAQKRQPAAGSATETALARARRFHQFTGQRGNFPRLLVNAAIPPQITRIVEDNLLSRPLFDAAAGPRTAPETRCGAPPRAACRTPSSPPESCARSAGKSTRSSSPCSASGPQGSPRPVAERPDRCPAAAPDRPCISPCAARQSSSPRYCITRTSASTISRPLGS